MMFLPVLAEEDKEWDAKPIITHIYELAKEKFLIEWEGNASLYQVYIDGKKAVSVNVPATVIEVKSGIHQITVMPVTAISKEGGKTISFEVEAEGLSGIAGGLAGLAGLTKLSGLSDVFQQLQILGENNSNDIKIGLDMDLGALGIEAKDLVMGNPSDTIKINYTPTSFSDSAPEILSAYMGFDERVELSFTDKFDSNIYRVYITSGKDMTYVDYDLSDEKAASLISKDRSRVTMILDPEYLESRECMVPELDQKYSFSVKLQKWPVDFIYGTKEMNILLESKESKAFDYTPAAAWKNPPVITYASQTADGQITLQWDHDDNGLGCEYKIKELDVLLGVKKGEKEIGRTTEKEFMITDLVNGKYTYAVVPFFSAEEGSSSESVTVEVNNNWVAAPSLQCEAEDQNRVLLKWTVAEGVESYHIKVSVGTGSLLRFVKLDYKVYEEFIVDVEPGDMDYTYTYDQQVDPENGTNLKFEIYGIRYAADGSEQRSASTTQTITLK